MSKAIFHLNLLKNYQLVNVPGTYYVTVAYTVNDNHLILDGHPRYLVPLRAITPIGLEKVLKIVKDEKTVVSFDKVSSHFMRGALWVNKVLEEELPIKGERVLASFDLVEGKLVCTHIELLPREDLDYVDINSLTEFRQLLTNLIKMKE